MKHSKMILAAILAFALGIGNIALAKEPGDQGDKSKAGWKEIHYLARDGKARELEHEQRRPGFSVHSRTQNHWMMPIHIAARNNSRDVIKELIKLRADVNAKDRYGKTALHEATQRNYRDIMLMLIRAGADVNQATDAGLAPLHTAAQNGRFLAAKLLLEKGADIESKNKWGETPMHQALVHGHSDFAKKLIKRHGADDSDLRKTHNYKRTWLHNAALRGNLKYARALHEMGLEIDARDHDYATPLHYAAWHGKTDVARYLIQNGADIYLKERHNRTPYDMAWSQHGRLGDTTIVFREYRHYEWQKECKKKWGGFHVIACPEFNPHFSGN